MEFSVNNQSTSTVLHLSFSSHPPEGTASLAPPPKFHVYSVNLRLMYSKWVTGTRLSARTIGQETPSALTPFGDESHLQNQQDLKRFIIGPQKPCVCFCAGGSVSTMVWRPWLLIDFPPGFYDKSALALLYCWGQKWEGHWEIYLFMRLSYMQPKVWTCNLPTLTCSTS